MRFYEKVLFVVTLVSVGMDLYDAIQTCALVSKMEYFEVSA